MGTIVECVASFYQTTTDKLTSVVKGPQKGIEARKIAMYLCQELAQAKLNDIADYFNLGHAGSVSFITHQIRRKVRGDKMYLSRMNELILAIMKQAT